MGNSLGMRRRNIDPSDVELLEQPVNGDVNSSSAPGDVIDDAEDVLAFCNVDPVTRSPQREKLRRSVLMRELFPKIKRPRVNHDSTQFWISPFERLPFKEPVIKSNGHYYPGEPSGKYFPRFLRGLLNQNFHLHMNLKCTNAKPEVLKMHPEVKYLMRNIKYVKVLLMKHPLDDKLRVYVEESHGRRRNTSMPKLRPMYVKFILLDHVNSSIFISGGEFLLSLLKPRSGPCNQVNWSESNGQVPHIIGHYSRELDSNPNIIIEWSVYAWNWYNKTEKL